MRLFPIACDVAVRAAKGQVGRLGIGKLSQETPPEARLAHSAFWGDIKLPPVQSLVVWEVASEVAEEHHDMRIEVVVDLAAPEAQTT